MKVTQWSLRVVHVVFTTHIVSLITIYAKIKNLSPLSWSQVWLFFAYSLLAVCVYFGYQMLNNYLQKILHK